MAGVTSSQRELGWNVRILISSSQACFAGFYQQDDFVTVATTTTFSTTQVATMLNISLQRRRDDRYLPIGKSDDNPLFKTVPLRCKKRPRTASASTSRSQSPTKGGGDDDIRDDDGFPETFIPADEARPIINEFRQSVIAGGHSRCAISSQGSAWWSSGVGPAVQAVHIVPQIHWNVFPYRGQGVAPTDNISALKEAWEQTWHMSNGLVLMSHLHQCFDARLLSIDPTTHQIRAFMPYDVITGYHGKVAYLPEHVSRSALQHHYDMCCIENMAAKRQLGSSTYLRSTSTTVLPVAASPVDPSPGDPAKKGQPQPQPQVQGNQSDIQSQGDADVTPQQRLAKQPLSPPPSENESSRERLWRVGEVYFTDAQEAERKRQEGWNVIEVDSEDGQDSEGSSSEEERGRPRKRRCTIAD
ncbi:hypothetical protein DHEL01_v210852 [Diaporthe helianthi]|uniref:HNH nuclease domain-containing protein n=1 Tax=Diaporthe helianthi TaxID=158607 RepID=A0A2P5HKJ8_DIAHE|nr:hypothetical protein DHEL01_v210852 [Diaporthe helianthi]